MKTNKGIFHIADTDVGMDIENFQRTQTFSKNRGHGHDEDKPRTNVSIDLWLFLRIIERKSDAELLANEHD